MPLPAAELELVPQQGSTSMAFLVRVPEDVWGSMRDSAMVTVNDKLTIDLGYPVALSAQSHQPVDLYTASGSQLAPLATASTRLSFPLSTSLAADRLRAQNDALELERRQRAERVTGMPGKATAGKAGKPAAAPRSASASALDTRAAKPKPASLARATTTAAAAAVTTAAPPPRPAPAIPLKTRVVQLLAVGQIGMPDLVARLGAAEDDVARVVNVVGRADGAHYTLVPNQYSKVKLAAWDYTSAEREIVIGLARAAFDELGLPPDADERLELERKAAEAAATVPASAPVPTPAPVAYSHTTAAPAAPRAPAPASENGASDSGSASASSSSSRAWAAPAAPGATGVAASAVLRKSAPTMALASGPGSGAASAAAGKADKDRTKVGKQIAKFRAEHVKRASSLARAHEGAPTPDRDATSTAAAKEMDRDRDRDRERDRDRGGDGDGGGKGKGKRVDKAKDEATVNGKRKRDDLGARGNGHAKETGRKSRASPIYTSSEDEGRGRARKVKATRAGADGDGADAAQRRKPSASPPPAKKARDSAGSGPGAVRARPPPPARVDSEALRERYEELFPAYERLSDRLAGLYDAAEHARAGRGAETGEVGVLAEDELRKLVERWGRWHHELEEIRRHFVDG
ncbi:hypothetical protein Q5752_001931 [Cryptotrichosporon argae]